MRVEVIDERPPPGVAGRRIAERVQFQRYAFGYAQFDQQLMAERQELDVRLRFGCANDLRIELVKLAEAALLRTLVTKCRAVGRDLQRCVLLPAFAQIR